MTLAIALEPAPIETDLQGVVRVAKTRVTLDTVVTAFLEGCTPEEIGGSIHRYICQIST